MDPPNFPPHPNIPVSPDDSIKLEPREGRKLITYLMFVANYLEVQYERCRVVTEQPASQPASPASPVSPP